MQSDLRLNWLIAIALTGWLFYLLAPVLTPFIAAALLAYVGDPLADRLQKLRMPRTLAVVTVFLIRYRQAGRTGMAADSERLAERGSRRRRWHWCVSCALQRHGRQLERQDIVVGK
jgi:hypothetical protein